MPIISSQADLVRDLESLLDAAERSPEVKAFIESERLSLEASVQTLKVLKAEQEELTARRQEVTQKLQAAMAQARDLASLCRAVVKGKLGMRNERLVHFKVAPLRKRTRKPIIVVKPKEGVVSDSLPDAPASPPVKPAA